MIDRNIGNYYSIDKYFFLRLFWYFWKILFKINYILRNEYGCISGYEFCYVVN